jgi:hypothetical protein
MPDPPGPAARRHKRANWVALRTLRQVPKVVGETPAGDPIVEIRSVRLVLRGDASHFNRIAACSKCGREVPGAAVLSPADLDHVPNAVICKDCVKKATAPFDATRSRPTTVAPVRAADPVSVTTNGSASSPVESPGVRDDRLEALERQVKQLTELLGAQGTAAGSRTPHDDERDRRLDGLVERMDRFTVAGNDRMEAIEARIDGFLDRLTHQSEAQRSALSSALDAQADRAATRDRELAQAQDEMGRRLAAVTERASVDAAAPFGAVEARLEELTARVDRQRPEWEGALSAAVGGVQAELTTALAAGADNVARAQDERVGLVEGVVARLQHQVGTDGDRLSALEQRVEEASATAAAQRSQLPALVDERIGDLGADRENELADLREDLARLRAESGERLSEVSSRVDREIAAHDEAVRALTVRLDQVSAGLEAETAGRRSDAAERAVILDEVSRVEAQMSERLERRAERALRAEQSDRERLEAVERRVQEALASMSQAPGGAAAVEALQTRFEAGLDEARKSAYAAVAELGRRLSDRLVDLETDADEQENELAQLLELQTALDGGLGELRSAVADLAKAIRPNPVAHPVEGPSGPSDGVPAAPASGAVTGRGRGRRLAGRSSVEASSELAAVAAVADGVAQRQEQLEAALAELESDAAEAIAAAAAASSQASSLAPLRSEVRALREQLAAQAEVLSALTESMAAPTRAAPTGKAAAPRALAKPATATVRSGKGSAAKSTPSKGQAARAAIAKAAAAKAAPGTRPTRAAKKAR